MKKGIQKSKKITKTIKVFGKYSSMATQALKSFESKKTRNDILAVGEDQFIYMGVSVGKLPTSDNVHNFQLSITNSIYGGSFNTESLFIVSNEFFQTNKAFLKTLRPAWRFIKYDKVKSNFKLFKDK